MFYNQSAVPEPTFIPLAWEIRQLKRQRALRSQGFTECTVDLVGRRIVAKIDRRAESLDDKPLPPLTATPGRV